jgi:hypothetical protein
MVNVGATVVGDAIPPRTPRLQYRHPEPGGTTAGLAANWGSQSRVSITE